MKTHTFTAFIILFSATFFNTALQAQSELPKFAPSPKKVKCTLDFPKEGRSNKKGRGFSANLEALGKVPARVALVSFYGFDPGLTSTSTHTSSGGFITTTTTSVSKRSSGGNAGPIAVGFYETGIAGMKDRFKEAGITILEPEEFLDTEEKKTYYNQFNVQHRAVSDFFRNLGSGNHDAIYSYPSGFRVMDVTDEPYGNYSKSGMFATYKKRVTDKCIYLFNKDTKMMESLGNDLAKALGVDAVLIVYFTHIAPKDKQNRLMNATMVMFGPNPIPMPPGKDDMNLRYTGQFYCATRCTIDKLFRKANKKKPETQAFDYTGFNNILVALADKMCVYLKEETQP